jgi:hypothetical protein
MLSINRARVRAKFSLIRERPDCTVLLPDACLLGVLSRTNEQNHCRAQRFLECPRSEHGNPKRQRGRARMTRRGSESSLGDECGFTACSPSLTCRVTIGAEFAGLSPRRLRSEQVRCQGYTGSTAVRIRFSPKLLLPDRRTRVMVVVSPSIRHSLIRKTNHTAMDVQTYMRQEVFKSIGKSISKGMGKCVSLL